MNIRKIVFVLFSSLLLTGMGAVPAVASDTNSMYNGGTVPFEVIYKAAGSEWKATLNPGWSTSDLDIPWDFLYAPTLRCIKTYYLTNSGSWHFYHQWYFTDAPKKIGPWDGWPVNQQFMARYGAKGRPC